MLGIAGGEVTIKPQFSGNIYLTYSKKSQLDNLLKCVLFGGIAPVAVTAHKSLNSAKGVIGTLLEPILKKLKKMFL